MQSPMVYETEDKKSIVVTYASDEESAIKQANKFFKRKKSELLVRRGYVNSVGLYWEEEPESIPCFAVWRA